MLKKSWRIENAQDAIIFDCDGTLSRIEGIDVLAEKNNVGAEVSAMTAEAMNETGVTLNLYQKRLSLVRPSRKQLIDLGQEYYESRSPSVDAVISALKRLQKSLYVISAGLNPAVRIFAALLNIPRDHVFAVDVHFNEAGDFVDFDESAPTAHHLGKAKIIAEIQKQHPRVVHMGDGMNDLEVVDQVDRFIGYGGACYREKIAAKSPFYIKIPSFAPVLPLVLTENEYNHLTDQGKAVYGQGVNDIENELVSMLIK